MDKRNNFKRENKLRKGSSIFPACRQAGFLKIASLLLIALFFSPVLAAGNNEVPRQARELSGGVESEVGLPNIGEMVSWLNAETDNRAYEISYPVNLADLVSSNISGLMDFGAGFFNDFPAIPELKKVSEKINGTAGGRVIIPVQSMQFSYDVADGIFRDAIDLKKDLNLLAVSRNFVSGRKQVAIDRSLTTNVPPVTQGVKDAMRDFAKKASSKTASIVSAVGDLNISKIIPTEQIVGGLEKLSKLKDEARNSISNFEPGRVIIPRAPPVVFEQNENWFEAILALSRKILAAFTGDFLSESERVAIVPPEPVDMAFIKDGAVMVIRKTAGGAEELISLSKNLLNNANNSVLSGERIIFVSKTGTEEFGVNENIFNLVMELAKNTFSAFSIDFVGPRERVAIVPPQPIEFPSLAPAAEGAKTFITNLSDRASEIEFRNFAIKFSELLPDGTHIYTATTPTQQFIVKIDGKQVAEQILKSGKSALAPFTQDFILERSRVPYVPPESPPLITPEQRQLVIEFLQKVKDYNYLSIFSKSDREKFAVLDINKLDDETLAKLANRIAERLPEIQQIIKETQTIREVQTKQTTIVTNEVELNKLASLIAALTAKQEADRQSLFNIASLGQRINTINNVTITNPTITNPSFTAGSITDADIPDTITVSNYLPLGGGTVTATLKLGPDAPLYASSTLQVGGAVRLYGDLTVDGTVNLASSVLVTSIVNVTGNQSVGGDIYVYGGDINLGTGLATTTLTSAGGNLGIATTSPYSGFSVWGSGTTTSQLFSLINNASSTLVQVLDSGSFGIGTTSPGALLAVQGNALFSGNLNVANIVATGTLSLTGTTGTSTIASNLDVLGNLQIGSICINCGSGGGFTGGTTTVNNLIVTNFSTSTFVGGLTVQTNKFVVDNQTGNVGIGTTTPSKLFSVHGDSLFSGNIFLANLTATGTLSVSGNTSLANASTTGMLTIGNGFISQASSTISNSLQVAGLLQASSSLSVGGGTALGSTLSVTGTSTLAGLSAGFGTFSSNIVTSGSLDVTGTSTIAGLSAGFGTFSSNLVTSKDLSVSGLANLTGFISNASSTISNSLQVSGVLNASSTLNVTGLTTLSAPLALTGSLNVRSTNNQASVIILDDATPTAASRKWSIANNYTEDGGLAFGQSTTNIATDALDNPKVVFSSTGSVGIGTTSPQAKLDIYAASGSNALRLVNSSINNANLGHGWTFYNNTNSGNSNFTDLRIYEEGNTDRMTLLAGGNVGIGTTTPGALLSVQGTGLFTGTLTAPNIIATGTLTLSGDTYLANASTTGMLTIGNGFISQASSTISNSLQVAGLLQASSSLSVGGGTALGSTLSVTGTSTLAGLSAGFGTFSSNLVTSGSLDVTGTSTIAGLSAGFGTFSSNLVTSKDLSVSGLANLTGFISSASSTVSGNLQVSGGLNASSTLTVASGARFYSTLQADSLSSFVGGFISSASSTIAGNFHTSGVLNASSTLLVANLSTLTGGFISSASSTVASTLHISGNLQASSTVSLATTTITVNHASGSPGIPLTLLNIQTATNTANRLAFQISGATSTLTTSAITSQLIQNYDPGKGILAFSVLNSGLLSEAARFDSNGFLGIGTTSPGALLAVHGDALISGTTTVRALVATSSSLSVGGSNFVVNASGNVGIGTAGPLSKFVSVKTKSDTVSVANSAAYIGDQSYNTGLVIQSLQSSPYGVALQNMSPSGTAYPLILNPLGGNVGIGTTSPGALLAVHGNALISGNLNVANIVATGTLNVSKLTTLSAPLAFTGSLNVQSTDNQASVIILDDTTPAANSRKWSIANNYTEDGGLAFGQSTTNSATDAISNPKVVFSLTGNVGIGTTSPGQLLSVHGNALIAGTTTVHALIATSSSLSVGGSNFVVDASGNVGIGTTSPGTLLSIGGDAVGINFGLATSTFSTTGGINLKSGCFAVGGVCVSGGGAGSVGSATLIGQVPYYAAVGTTLTATSTIFIGTNSRVSIGTTTTDYDFAVAGRDSAFNSSADGSLGAWASSSNPLPIKQYARPAVAANGYVYFLANPTSYSAKINSDGTIGPWASSSNSVPKSSIGNAAVVANGYVYALGGYTTAGESSVHYAKLNTDGTIGAWASSTNSLPAPLYTGSAAAANGYIYYIGGNNGSTGVTSVYYARLNADGSTGAWMTNPNTLPQGRTNHSTVVANGYIYVIGGRDTTIKSTVYYAKLNANGSTGAFATAVPSISRQDASAVVANGYLYIIGGDNSAVQTTVYYAKLNSDGSIGALSTNDNALPDGLYSHSSVVVNGYVYVIGGYDGNDGTNTVYYSSVARTKISGNLDLLGFASTTLGGMNSGGLDGGSVGGSIFAGNIFSAGQLEVTGNTQLWNGLNVNGPFSMHASSTPGNLVFSITSATSSSAISTIFSISSTGSTTASSLTLNSPLDMGSSTPQINTLYKENIVKAWASFTGVGTIAVRDGFNVASLTDNGTGIYTVTWKTNFATENYAAVCTVGDRDSDIGDACAMSAANDGFGDPQTTSTFRIDTSNGANASVDVPDVFVIAIGDQ